MSITVKQFIDTLDEMHTIYPFEDDKTEISTQNLITGENNILHIYTKDEKTDIEISMEKKIKS